MSVTQRLMKPGRWDLRLRDDTPTSIRNAVQEFDHIVITPIRLLPLAAYTDAGILAAAKDGGYCGVIHEFSTPTSLSGAGLAWWLGSDDGRGDLLDAAVSYSTVQTLSTWVTALLPSSITAGTVTNTGTSYSGTFQYPTRREALDWVCRAVGAEWRVNADFTFDAAAPATLFVTTPTAVITRKPEGIEGGYSGIEAEMIVAGRDVSGYTTKVIVVGRSGDGAQVAVGSATGANVYKDGLNNNVVLERLVNAPDLAAANVSTLATNTLNLFSSVRRSLALSSRTYAVPLRVRPGDYVYVYDPDARLVDTANQITWRGETIAPVKLRCKAYSWPITRGMGVYARRSGATPTYTDLTDYVEWETGETQWEVGTSTADPEQDPTQLSPAYLGVNPDIVQRNNAVAGVLTITDNQTATTALASGISTSETSTNLTTTAVATLAGRRYRITFACELRSGQNFTSYGTARVRRGTTTAGTVVLGPVGLSRRAGTASRDLVTIVAYDTPGAQSSQQWVLTLLSDNTLIDVYSPSFATVEDAGPA